MQTAMEMVTVPRTDELERDVTGIVVQANVMVIHDYHGAQAAGEFLRAIKTIRKRVDETFDDPIAKAFAAHRAMTAAKRKHDDPLAQAETIVKGKVGTYQREQERIRQAEEDRLRAIARRAEDERRQAEALRLEEASRAARAESERLAAAGKAKAAEEARIEADRRAQAAEAVIDAPPTAVAVSIPKAPTVAGVSHKANWQFRIVSATLIPREYMVPDEKKIGGVVKAMKGQTNIPGVEVYDAGTVAVRGY